MHMWTFEFASKNLWMYMWTSEFAFEIFWNACGHVTGHKKGFSDVQNGHEQSQ